MNIKIICLAAAMAALCATSGVAQSPVKGTDNPQGALSGRNIAMWQSHGRYFDGSEDRWKWQRCRLFGTVEDLYTRSYVVPFLVPMLENAGAYVMLPRERDGNRVELVIDSDGGYAIDGYSEHHNKHKWHDTKQPGFGLPVEVLTDSMNPFRLGGARYVKTVSPKHARKKSTATWSAVVPERGEYAVYISYAAMDKAVKDVSYTVHAATGDKHFTVDQTMGGGTWIYLGTFPFAESKSPHKLVSVSNVSAYEGVVSTDAVRLGGGMGNVARCIPGDEANARTSGMPRWAEASRYWLQWAGMPDSIYANQETDYRDDIFCRPQWVNYLRDELHIPVDLVMAFHSDAGTLGGDSIVGTLGIYYTEKKRGKYSDGRSKLLGGKLCKAIVNSVVNDIRAGYDSEWTQRKMRDASYIEARVPEVPTMLLELLSHQNLADMRYGHNPQFKFDVSRAVYKGILRYLSDQGQAKYVVQPLPPTAASLTELSAGRYRLNWSAQPDTLECTAMPSDYIVEVREGADADAPFSRLAEVKGTEFTVDIPAGEIRSYRIIARNAGGVSFPSEVLAAGYVRGAKGTVTVVNGFTRVSAPDDFEAGTMAGFGLYDAGVAYGSDLSFTGRQYDFDRTAPWVHDDQPGFGASRANMETKPVYGNLFDNVLAHGVAIMAAGYSFDSQSARAFTDDDRRPEAVDLLLGLQKETKIGRGLRPAAHKAFPVGLQRRLEALTADGVPLFVSGAYVASDAHNADTGAFLQHVLGVAWRSDHATAVGNVTEVRSRFSSDFHGSNFTFAVEPGAKPYAVTSPDAIYPGSADGVTIMRYDENQSPAAVAYAPYGHRAVTLGFPFEAIDSEAQRKLLMKQVLKFLNDK